MIKDCDICHKEYKTYKQNSKFCSIRCRNFWRKLHPIRYWTGKKHSSETKLKISESKMGQTPWNKGKKLTKEHVDKWKKSMEGKKLWNGKRSHMPWMQGKNNKNWKGDGVGYVSLHSWVKRKLGKAISCEVCGCENAKRYEWSNVSGEYRRDLDDWQQLCAGCHRKYDMENIWGAAVNKYPERERSNAL